MKKTNVSRREFLSKAGKCALGAAAASVVPMSLASAEGIEAPTFPWEWKEVDPQEAMVRGYDITVTSHCCSGGFGGVMDILAEKYGYPYNQVNYNMFWQGGGGYGQQSLCGALGGAVSVICTFLEPEEAGIMRNELYDWYKKRPFPQYYRLDKQVHSVAGSVDCRDSLGNWQAAAAQDTTIPADEVRAIQSDRCLGMTGEVAAKVADMLNIHFGFYTESKIPDVVVETEEVGENEYIGIGKSEIGGEIKVKVTMDGDKIAKIEVLSHSETAGLSDPAFATIPDAIIAAQSTEVDIVAGATKTCEALIAAVKDALTKVGK